MRQRQNPSTRRVSIKADINSDYTALSRPNWPAYYKNKKTSPTWNDVLARRDATWQGIIAVIQDYIKQCKKDLTSRQALYNDLKKLQIRPDYENMTADNKKAYQDDLLSMEDMVKSFSDLVQRAEGSITEIKNLLSKGLSYALSQRNSF